MQRESVIFDQSERVEKIMQNAIAFGEIRNTVLLANLNDLFSLCFEEMRDFSAEGFDNLYEALNKYFDCLEKTAVLVRDKRTAFRIEFTDIVCEQIDILYRGTCNTGSEHIFLRRMGIKDGFCSFETIREEVERLIGHGTNDDKFSLFQEDTATDKFFYSDLVEFEKQKVRFEKRGKLLEEDNVGEVNMSSVTPSSLDMSRVEIDNDLRHVLSGTRFKLAIAAGLLGVIGGAGVLVQKYTGFEKVDSVLERKEYVYDEKEIISESSTEDANTEIVRTGFAEEKEVSVICKIDQGAESYKKYLARLEDSSPRFFISNFRSAVNNAKGETSTADVESVRRSLFTDFLKEMGKNVDDKLTRDFVEIHTRNFKSFSGGEWRDGAEQTALIYNVIEPDCE